MLLDFLEKHDQWQAEQSKHGQQSEVIRIGQQCGLLLHAAIKRSQSLLMRGDHVRALGEKPCLQAADEASLDSISRARVGRQIILMHL